MTKTPTEAVNRRRMPAWAIAFAAVAAVHIVIALDLLVVRRIYDAGRFQTAGSYVNSVATMLQVPGVAFVWFFTGLVKPLALSHIAVLWTVNVVAWFAAAWAAVPVLRYCFGRRPHPKPTEPFQADPLAIGRPTRRRFLAGATAAVAAAAGGVGAYSLLYEPRAYRVQRYVLPIADLPESLDGLTIAHLTDLHHCAWIPLPYIRDVVRTTNALKPDLILLTGDYVRTSPVYLRPVMAEVAKLRARIAMLATLGNHDWWEGAPLTRKCLAEAGIPLLDNARLFIRPDRQLAGDAERGLCIAGVGDLWCDRPSYDAALAGVPRAMPRLLLSHNPDVAEERRFVSCGHRVDLMLSGHTHGGQVWLPGLGAPMTPSLYGTKYARGLVQGPTTRVFISPGIGISGLPVRMGVRPEISLLELRRAV